MPINFNIPHPSTGEFKRPIVSSRPLKSEVVHCVYNSEVQEFAYEELRDSFGDVYCCINGGDFLYGPNKESRTFTTPFTLAKYPVTKAKFLSFLNEVDRGFSDHELETMRDTSPFDDCPALNVSWGDAMEYCRWLRQKSGEYYTLPTELQWELAARGTDGRVYPWGDKPEINSQLACYDDEELITSGCTSSVGYYPGNCSPYGVMDMVGNVMEWTLDSFEDERDPHIVRGGSWRSKPGYCNNFAQCMSHPPNLRFDFIGFRLVYIPESMFEVYSASAVK